MTAVPVAEAGPMTGEGFDCIEWAGREITANGLDAASLRPDQTRPNPTIDAFGV
jgi:hypothetical protein